MTASNAPMNKNAPAAPTQAPPPVEPAGAVPQLGLQDLALNPSRQDGCFSPGSTLPNRLSLPDPPDVDGVQVLC